MAEFTYEYADCRTGYLKCCANCARSYMTFRTPKPEGRNLWDPPPFFCQRNPCQEERVKWETRTGKQAHV